VIPIESFCLSFCFVGFGFFNEDSELGNKRCCENLCGGRLVMRELTFKQFAHLQSQAAIPVSASFAGRLLESEAVKSLLSDILRVFNSVIMIPLDREAKYHSQDLCSLMKQMKNRCGLKPGSNLPIMRETNRVLPWTSRVSVIVSELLRSFQEQQRTSRIVVSENGIPIFTISPFFWASDGPSHRGSELRSANVCIL
jgi:hypothetical protein